jgi:hypothetical protein
MSGWKIVTKALHAAGGGPLPATKFDPCDMPRTSFLSALANAVTYGFVASDQGQRGRNRSVAGLFSLTPLGRDWCEGMVQVTYIGISYRMGKRAPMSIAATWLKALPRRGEINLKGTDASSR